MTSPLVYDLQNQVKYVIILNAYTNDTNRLKRLNNAAQQEMTIIVRNTLNSTNSHFESPIYNINILDITPNGTLILVVKYTLKGNYDLQIQQKSTLQIDAFFNIENKPNQEAIFITLQSTVDLKSINIEQFSLLLVFNDSQSLVNINILSWGIILDLSHFNCHRLPIRMSSLILWIFQMTR